MIFVKKSEKVGSSRKAEKKGTYAIRGVPESDENVSR